MTLQLSIMAQVVQVHEATTAFEKPDPDRWVMNHPHGFIEQHSRRKPDGGAVQSSTIVDADPARSANARYDSKRDDAHAQHI